MSTDRVPRGNVRAAWLDYDPLQGEIRLLRRIADGLARRGQRQLSKRADVALYNLVAKANTDLILLCRDKLGIGDPRKL